MTGSQLSTSVEGIFTEDPTVRVPIGTRIRFETAPVAPEVTHQTATLANWEFFRGMLLSIGFMDRNSFRVEGSAVLIAPGVALCAAHVIQPRLAALQAGAMDAVCQGITPHGLQLWTVRHISVVQNSDLVILGVALASALPPDGAFLLAQITTRMPALNEEILMFGFCAAEGEFAIESELGTEVEGEVRISKGTVSNSFPAGRDRGMMPWPVLEVLCPAKGGMSGGPAFDSQGRLVGLISSSIDLPDGDGISYVSMLWPALGATFESSWPEGLIRSPTSLLELDPRICNIDRPLAVTRQAVDGGSEYRLSYTPWSQI